MGGIGAIGIAHFYFMKWINNLSIKNITQEIDGNIYVETWVDIKGYESIYQISSFGRIKSLKRFGCRKDRIVSINFVGAQNKRYLAPTLRKNNKIYKPKVHVLVCSAFHENIHNKPTVNHIDGIKTNNFYKNVEWSTWSENHRHAFRIGLKKYKYPRQNLNPPLVTA